MADDFKIVFKVPLKAILPFVLNKNQARSKLTEAVAHYSKRIQKDFYTLVTPWNHPVSFVQRTTSSWLMIRATIETDDKIFFWLDEGTSVRYATMSQDFKPKTKHRTLTSFPGAGEVAYISRRVARPGIEAHQFVDAMRVKHEDRFLMTIKERLDEILRGL